MTVRFVNREWRVPMSNMTAIIIGMFTIISGLVTLVWQGRAYYDGMMIEKKETNNRLTAIEKKLNIAPVDTFARAQVAQVNKRVDTLMIAGLVEHKPGKQGKRFYIERKINGKLQVIEVD